MIPRILVSQWGKVRWFEDLPNPPVFPVYFVRFLKGAPIQGLSCHYFRYSVLIQPLLAIYLINVWHMGLEGAWFAL